MGILDLIFDGCSHRWKYANRLIRKCRKCEEIEVFSIVDALDHGSWCIGSSWEWRAATENRK